jgi:hypothetical protein
MLIRAVGPSLSAFGVTDALATPRLTLYDQTGKVIAVSVPWSATNGETQIEMRSAAKRAGAFPLAEGSADAVLLIVLEAGNYTCVVDAPAGTSGTTLIETYIILAPRDLGPGAGGP